MERRPLVSSLLVLPCRRMARAILHVDNDRYTEGRARLKRRRERWQKNGGSRRQGSMQGAALHTGRAGQHRRGRQARQAALPGSGTGKSSAALSSRSRRRSRRRRHGCRWAGHSSHCSHRRRHDRHHRRPDRASGSLDEGRWVGAKVRSWSLIEARKTGCNMSMTTTGS